MNKEVKTKKQVKKTEAETTPTSQTESGVLTMRKAQAAELAEKINPDFSLDKELHDIKTTLLDSDEPSGLINEKGEVVKLPEEVALKAEEEAKPKKTSSKPKKDPSEVKPKKDPSEVKPKKPIVKPQEPIVAEKQEAVVPLAPKEQKKPVKKEKPKQETVAEGLPFVKTSEKEPAEEEKVIDNLQKLKDQIQAQKSLERELMKREAIKVQDKDVKIMDKLTALEELIRQTDVNPEGEPYELEAQNKKLSKQLSDANAKIIELQKEFDRLDKERDNQERAALIDTIQRNEVTYNMKIEELEKLIKEQQVQVEDRMAIEVAKQKDLQNKIKKLQSQTAVTSLTAPTTKEIEDFKKQVQKEHEAEIQKSEKTYLLKEKQLLNENETLIKKYEKALAVEREKAEKNLLKKQEELLAKTNAQKLQYETKLTAQKEKAKLSLKEQKAKFEELAKLAQNDDLEKIRLDYEAQLAEKDKLILQANEEALKTLKEEKQRLQNERKAALKEQMQKIKADYEARLAAKEAQLKQASTEGEKLHSAQLLSEEASREYGELLAQKDLLVKQLTEEKRELQSQLAKKAEAYKDLENKLNEKALLIVDAEEELKVKIQELESNYQKNEAKLKEKYESEYAKEIKELNVLIATQAKDLEEAKANQELQKKNLADLETKLTNQSSVYQKQLDEERARSIAFINEATKDRSNQRNQLNEEIKEVKLEAEGKINAIREKHQEALATIESYRREVEKIKTQYDVTYHSLQEEKNRHFENERRLSRELDDRNEEIKKLKADIERVIKASETNKLETQLNQIAKLVDDLGNKSKETPYNMRGYNYEYEKEYEIRKRITEAIKKEEEEAERRKQDDLKEGFNTKIAGLESQIQDLGSLLKSKVDNKTEQSQVIKSLSEDLDSFKKQLMSEVETELKSKETEMISPLRKLINDYKRDKDILLYQYNNEINNLEVDKKFVTNLELVKTIDDKIRFAKLRYVEKTKQRDIQFQRDLAALGNYTITLDAQTYITPETLAPVGEAPVEQKIQDEELVLEEKIIVSSEPTIPDEATSPEEPVLEEEPSVAPPTEELTSDVNRSSKHSTVVYARPSGIEAFSGTVDQEYLRRLSNIKQLRIQLENRKKEITANFEADMVAVREQESRLVLKITEVNQKMDLLKLEYEKKPFSSKNQAIYETENTRLNIELESRKEQLRQLREEDLVKLNYRYEKAFANIEAQLQVLLAEERNLKNEYVLKQQKTQSRIIRDEEVERKLQDEKHVGRIIESQEAIKQRNLNLNEEKETPPLEEEKPAALDGTSVKQQEQLQAKEQELRKMYNKYVNVQKKLQSDFPSVKEYHEVLETKLSLLQEEKKLTEKISELEEKHGENKASGDNDLYNKELSDLNINRELYRDKLAFANTNLEKLAANERVSDYIKIIERISLMDEILKQYALRIPKK